MKILRVFLTKTKATPDDEMVRFGEPGLFPPTNITKVYVSVLFTWMKEAGERLAEAWNHVAPVEIGGPGMGTFPGEFEPGLFIKPGYVFTMRGCLEKCGFCRVPSVEGTVRTLKINKGWNLLDNNILACPEQHIRDVFKMLEEFKGIVEFTGGIQAARLKPWHVDLFLKVKPKQVFFAYDDDGDLEPLNIAMKMMVAAGFKPRQLRTYVLIGMKGDTFELAEKRLRHCLAIGSFPMAMLWRNYKGERDMEWARFQRGWARPAAIAMKAKKYRVESLAEAVRRETL